ncbi:MAG: hypothetical protein WCI71_17645, partial [Bacteroidota bacterium]
MTTEPTTQSEQSRWTRRLLWFAAFLIILPGWGYGLSTGNLLLALTGLPVFAFLIYLSFSKLVCPGCGKA